MALHSGLSFADRYVLDDAVRAFGAQPTLANVVSPAVATKLQALNAGNVDAVVVPSAWDRLAAQQNLTKVYSKELAFARDVFLAPLRFLEDARNLTFYARFLKAVELSILFLRRESERATKIVQDRLKGPRQQAEIIVESYLPSSERSVLGTKEIEFVISGIEVVDPSLRSRLAQLKIDNLVTTGSSSALDKHAKAQEKSPKARCARLSLEISPSALTSFFEARFGLLRDALRREERIRRAVTLQTALFKDHFSSFERAFVFLEARSRVAEPALNSSTQFGKLL